MGNILSCCCQKSGKYKPIPDTKTKTSNGNDQIVNGSSSNGGPIPYLNDTALTDIFSVDEADRVGEPVESHRNQIPLLEIPKSPPIQKYAQPNRPLDHYYNMSHNKRGKALIFNHETFEIHSPRIGTNLDRDRLKDTLASLDFDVSVYENRKISEIKNILRSVAQMDHSESDCLVVVFLTHGEMVPFIHKKKDRCTILTHDLVSYLHAHDNKYTLQTIWECFTDEQCPTLKDKPRIFLIQACQGDRIDYGHYMPRTPSSEHLPTTEPPLFASRMSPSSSLIRKPGRDIALFESRKYVPFEGIQIDPSKNLPQKDFLIVYSTMLGYYSYRDIETGTWYIEALCNVINEKSNELDLLNMLTIVNQQVAINYESDNAETKKQMPCVVSMLTKLVLFSKKNAHINGH